MHSTSSHSYRPDIDGLRAVAVVSVVLYHARVPGFGGGFLGVDIFFVISGFLITNILLKDGFESGAGIVRFYERRIRRIVPALVVLLTAASITAAIVLSPYELKNFARSLVATTAFMSNIDFMRRTGYFGSVSSDTPLLHLWSLAVEEQFYITYPLFLWGMMRLRARALLATVLGLLVVSLALSIWDTTQNSGRAFFFTPSRAWEILLGAAVALTPQHRRLPHWLTEALTLAAALMIAVSVWRYSGGVPWPGIRATLPCIGAALLIALNSHRRTMAGRLLSLRPLVFVGLISYSLYLWHWPIFVFYSRVLLRPIAPIEYAMLISLSATIAWLSWRFVERPFRRANAITERPSLFRIAGSAGLVLLGAGGAAFAADGFPQRFSPEFLRADETMAYRNAPTYQRAFHTRDCFGSDAGLSYSFERCFVPVSGQANVVLWGDSHAMHYVAGFDALFANAGVHLIQATYAGCRPLEESSKESFGCRAFNRGVLDRLDHRITAVIMSGRWFPHNSTPNDSESELLPGLSETARRIARLGLRVIVLGPSPEYFEPEPLYVERFLLTGDRSLLNAAPRLRPEIVARDQAMLKLFNDIPGISYVSVLATACPDNRCPMISQGVPMHGDRNHLSIEGSQLMAKKLWPKIHQVISR